MELGCGSGHLARIHPALLPTGLFVFDLLCTRTTGHAVHSKTFRESDRWVVAVEKIDSRERVTRRIISFVRERGGYQRTTEIHKLRRYNLNDVVSLLREIGFAVSTRRGYGRKPLEPYHTVIVATKRMETKGGASSGVSRRH
ncbi:MAG: hypothetical protein HBSIN02_07830 [Bacteroidia bacterium]|nr:MAG: hypothetical protein HBSIN02_07830 [Bacteroidia bacterium]